MSVEDLLLLPLLELFQVYIASTSWIWPWINSLTISHITLPFHKNHKNTPLCMPTRDWWKSLRSYGHMHSALLVQVSELTVNDYCSQWGNVEMHVGNDRCSEVGPIISIWFGGSPQKCLSNVRVADSMRVWFGLKDFLCSFWAHFKA